MLIWVFWFWFLWNILNPPWLFCVGCWVFSSLNIFLLLVFCFEEKIILLEALLEELPVNKLLGALFWVLLLVWLLLWSVRVSKLFIKLSLEFWRILSKILFCFIGIFFSSGLWRKMLSLSFWVLLTNKLVWFLLFWLSALSPFFLLFSSSLALLFKSGWFILILLLLPLLILITNFSFSNIFILFSVSIFLSSSSFNFILFWVFYFFFQILTWALFCSSFIFFCSSFFFLLLLICSAYFFFSISLSFL